MTGNNKANVLLTAALILFLISAALFPFAVGITYSGRSEAPEHVLTYTTGKLTWDSATGIDANGAAEMSLFDAHYQNVDSQNSDSVVAPGTQGNSIVRLHNSVGYSIQYVAVLYQIKDEPQLPVQASLSGVGFADTQTYPLPDGVTESQVVRAVSGTLGGGQIQDFDILWDWTYFVSDERDVVDTQLGDKAAFLTADDVTVGLYIVVEEDRPVDPVIPIDPVDPTVPVESEDPDLPIDVDPDDDDPVIEEEDPDDPDYITPEIPQTGDKASGQAVALLALGGILLTLFVFERGRKQA